MAVCRVFYPTPGNAEGSFIWARVFAFANQFRPKVAHHPEAQYGIMVGDPSEGLLAPSSGGVVISQPFPRFRLFTFYP